YALLKRLERVRVRVSSRLLESEPLKVYSHARYGVIAFGFIAAAYFNIAGEILMNNNQRGVLIRGVFLLIGSCVLCGASAFSQSFSSQDRDRGITMLKIIKDDISKHYYDPAFHG